MVKVVKIVKVVKRINEGSNFDFCLFLCENPRSLCILC